MRTGSRSSSSVSGWVEVESSLDCVLGWRGGGRSTQYLHGIYTVYLHSIYTVYLHGIYTVYLHGVCTVLQCCVYCCTQHTLHMWQPDTIFTVTVLHKLDCEDSLVLKYVTCDMKDTDKR